MPMDPIEQSPQAAGKGRSSLSSCNGEQPWLDPNDFEPMPAVEVREVPLVQFHRAMVRLFRILDQPDPDVNYTKCDANSNGKVGWYEFCSFWKEHQTGDFQIAVKLTLAERIFLTLEDPNRSISGRIWATLVFAAILISVGCFIISTIPDFQTECILEGDPGHDPDCMPDSTDFFKDADLACVIFFSIEYGARLILSGVMRTELVERERRQLLEWMVTDETITHPSFLRRVSTWFFNPANLIDLCAIMPWFLSKSFETLGGSKDNMIIRLIRLTRVIRAIRLGIRFEQVVIVLRSTRRSVPALKVLVLNLVLGGIVFAATIFFFEQGSWDKQKKAYVRHSGDSWNPDTREWESQYDRSPFESIPHAFWWAIVTATTVGYGDMAPTTPAGKAVASLTMAWSLCVLALPIGVIGNNFNMVWTEYDKEKEREHWNAIKEEMMLKRSDAWGDLFHYSRKILLEVWHDPNPGEPDGLQAEFMGEVEFTVPEGVLSSKEPFSSGKLCYPLSSNFEKARRRVRGALFFEYIWTPTQDDKMGSDPDALVSGVLQVIVISGEDLISIDWKGKCLSDPYCNVVAYPKSPEEHGRVEPKWFRTETKKDTSDPEWKEEFKFDVHWTKAGTHKVMQADMKMIGESSGKLSVPIASGPVRNSTFAKQQTQLMAPEPTDEEKKEMLKKMVPELQVETDHLKEKVVPHIRAQINDVRQDLDLILSELRKRSVQGSVANGAVRASPDVSIRPVSNCSPTQQSDSLMSSARSANVSPILGSGPWAAGPTDRVETILLDSANQQAGYVSNLP